MKTTITLTTAQFREDCQDNISVRADGAIAHESLLARKYPDVDFLRGRLISIIEDHIREDEDGERIDWANVWREYE
jgi:hypothetical protein